MRALLESGSGELQPSSKHWWLSPGYQLVGKDPRDCIPCLCLKQLPKHLVHKELPK